jgi:seryl-tRNA synthetase
MELLLTNKSLPLPLPLSPLPQLPKRLVGFSHCFRREAGNRGNSLYRLHQFSKVEMVSNVCESVMNRKKRKRKRKEGEKKKKKLKTKNLLTS